MALQQKAADPLTDIDTADDSQVRSGGSKPARKRLQNTTEIYMGEVIYDRSFDIINNFAPVFLEGLGT